MPAGRDMPNDVIAQFARAGGVRPTHERDAQPKPVPQVLPYWYAKPPAGVDFYLFQTGVLAAGAGSTITFVGAGGVANPDIEIDSNYSGVVAGFTWFVNAPLVTIDITFTLQFTNAPVPGWDRFKPFPAAASSAIASYGGYVQCPARTLVSVVVTNNAASGPWTVGTEVVGWSYPTSDAQRVFGTQY